MAPAADVGGSPAALNRSMLAITLLSGLYTNTQLYHRSKPQGRGPANVGTFQTKHSELKGQCWVRGC